jgi:hypothetical protein
MFEFSPIQSKPKEFQISLSQLKKYVPLDWAIVEIISAHTVSTRKYQHLNF